MCVEPSKILATAGESDLINSEHHHLDQETPHCHKQGTREEIPETNTSFQRPKCCQVLSMCCFSSGATWCAFWCASVRRNINQAQVKHESTLIAEQWMV